MGWVWLELVAVLSNTALYTALPDAIPGPAGWASSPGAALHEAVGPLISSGALVPALAWGLAAAALPVVLRQRDLLVRTGAAAVWSALLLGTTLVLLSMGSGHPTIGVRNTLVGVAGGMVAALLASGPITAARAVGASDAGSRLA